MLLVLIGGLAALWACFADLRAGVYITLAVGFLADPIRKFVPGQPVVMNALVVVFAATTMAGQLLSAKGLRIPRTIAVDGKSRKYIRALAVVVILQTLLGFGRTRSIVVAIIGLIAYMSPVPAVMIGTAFVRNTKDFLRFWRVYFAFVVVMLSGVFLSLFGANWRSLEGVGEELYVYPKEYGEALRLIPGFFRTSEIAAWHATTAICILLMFAVAKRFRLAASLATGLVLLYLGNAMLLTGRRKGLAVVAIFSVLFGFLLVRFKRGTSRFTTILVVAFLGSAILGENHFFSERLYTRYRPYLERGETTTPSTGIERLRGLTLGSFRFISSENGFFGSGAGTGSQGSQYYGGGNDIVGGAAEGGLGKILAELGVPGLFLFLATLVVLARSIWRSLGLLNKRDPERARLAFGLCAYLIANGIEFASAHQAFGDPFVLLILGWSFGFLLALLQPLAADRTTNVASKTRVIEVAATPTVRAEPIAGIAGFDA